MHISDGILPPPVLAAGFIVTAAGTAWGLRGIRDEDIPKTAMLTAAFFTASLIHVPIGPGSVHLMLNGLAGIMLGWAAFPAILIGLLLQAVLFSHGGLTVLGVNTVTAALPAAVCGTVCRILILRKRPEGAAPFKSVTIVTACGIAAAAAIMLTGLMSAAALASGGSEFLPLSITMATAHVPVMIIEGFITAAVISFFLRVRPELIDI